MRPYFADLAARTLPRYTSYPTADRFRADMGAEQAAALDALDPAEPVSLYVHIPYCREICWYCGCNTGAIGRDGRLDAYVEALRGEIDCIARRVMGPIRAVHFGGGSPNALPADVLASLIHHIGDKFRVAAGAEIAVELDPRHFDRDYARVLAAAGVGRVSLGVQSFAGHVQRRINRVQPLATVREVVALLREAGIARINFDLLLGLPAQTLDDIADTVRDSITLRPDRIALFGYAHLPAMIARQRMIDGADLPDAAERFRQGEAAHDLLAGAGYIPIGFDHFAVPEDGLARAVAEGRLRRNFQGFTDDPCRTVIGLGASAISRFDGLLVQNEKHVGRYRERALAGDLAGSKGIVRTAEDRVRGRIIEKLLCQGKAWLPAEIRTTDLREFTERGLAHVQGPLVTVTDAGRPYARAIAAAFDGYRAGSQSVGQASAIK